MAAKSWDKLVDLLVHFDALMTNVRVGPVQGLRVVGADEDFRWYPPMSDGAFQDLCDDFEAQGARLHLPTGGHSPVDVEWLGAEFTLVHDVEGGVKVQITKLGHNSYSSLWKRIEQVIAQRLMEGDDWTPPKADAAPEEKVDWLTRAMTHVRDTLEKAKELSEEGQKKAYDAGRAIVEEAKEVAEGIKEKVTKMAESHDPFQLQKKYEEASSVMDDLWEKLKKGGAWAASVEAEAMGIVWLGGLVFLYLTVLKPMFEHGHHAA